LQRGKKGMKKGGQEETCRSKTKAQIKREGKKGGLQDDGRNGRGAVNEAIDAIQRKGDLTEI